MKKMMFLSLILLMAIVSCRRDKAFPPALKTYFPYAENQKLIYANEKGDTTCMVVTELNIEEQSEPYCSKCGSVIAMEFKAQNDSMYFYGLMSVSESPYLFLAAGDTHYVYNIPGDPFSEQIVSEIGDTIRLSKDGHEAVVVRYEGLVEFYDTKRECIWRIVK